MLAIELARIRDQARLAAPSLEVAMLLHLSSLTIAFPKRRTIRAILMPERHRDDVRFDVGRKKTRYRLADTDRQCTTTTRCTAVQLPSVDARGSSPSNAMRAGCRDREKSLSRRQRASTKRACRTTPTFRRRSCDRNSERQGPVNPNQIAHEHDAFDGPWHSEYGRYLTPPNRLR